MLFINNNIHHHHHLFLKITTTTTATTTTNNNNTNGNNNNDDNNTNGNNNNNNEILFIMSLIPLYQAECVTLTALKFPFGLHHFLQRGETDRETETETERDTQRVTGEIYSSHLGVLLLYQAAHSNFLYEISDVSFWSAAMFNKFMLFELRLYNETVATSVLDPPPSLPSHFLLLLHPTPTETPSLLSLFTTSLW